MSNESNNLYEFDEFSLNERERNFRRDNELVSLTPRVFDILLILLKAEGKTVSKEELLDRVWTDSIVEEANLSQNIYLLRQLFGRARQFIETVPRVGYRFAVPITVTPITQEPAVENGRNQASRSARQAFPMYSAAALVVVVGLTVAIAAFAVFRGSGEVTAGSGGPTFKNLPDVISGRPPAISPDGRFIAYLRFDSGRMNIRLRDISAESETEVTVDGGETPDRLEFSPDGKHLYFRTRGRARTSQSIYRIPYLGGSPIRVADDVWGGFAISPDSEQIAFFRANPSENSDSIVLKDLGNGTEVVRFKITAPDVVYIPIAPTWSPDGKRLAFLRRPKSGLRSKIEILDLTSGKVESVQTELSKIFEISWRPSGRSILALSKEPEKGRQIFDVDLASGQASRVTNDINMYAGLSVSKDGRTLLTEVRHLTSNVWLYSADESSPAQRLTSGTYGHNGLTDLNFATENRVLFDARSEIERDLWAVELDTLKHYRLTANNGTRNVETATTQNGEDVYYVSDRGGLDNLWRQGQLGGEAVRVSQSDREAHRLPALSADQRYLFFVVRSSEGNSIKKLSLGTGEVSTVFTSDKIAPLNFLEASPDGRYLAFEMKEQKADANDDSDDEAATLPFRLGILDLNGGPSLNEFVIRSSRPLIRFTNGGSTFDYLRHNAIFRQDVKDPTKEPQKVFEVSEDTIYNFDWSLSGSKLAIARGKLNRDLVVITLPE